MALKPVVAATGLSQKESFAFPLHMIGAHARCSCEPNHASSQLQRACAPYKVVVNISAC